MVKTVLMAKRFVADSTEGLPPSFRGREGPFRRANLGARRSVYLCTRTERNDEWHAPVQGPSLRVARPGGRLQRCPRLQGAYLAAHAGL